MSNEVKATLMIAVTGYFPDRATGTDMCNKLERRIGTLLNLKDMKDEFQVSATQRDVVLVTEMEDEKSEA